MTFLTISHLVELDVNDCGVTVDFTRSLHTCCSFNFQLQVLRFLNILFFFDVFVKVIL